MSKFKKKNDKMKILLKYLNAKNMKTHICMTPRRHLYPSFFIIDF